MAGQNVAQRIDEIEETLERVRTIERLVDVEKERLRRVLRRLERVNNDDPIPDDPSWEGRTRNVAFAATLLSLLSSFHRDSRVSEQTD